MVSAVTDRSMIADVLVLLEEQDYNEILDETHFGAADAKAVEKTVYEIFTNRKASVIQEILAELNNAGATAYKDLSKEMQAYMDYVCDTVLAKNTGILNMDLVDTKDETYLAWAKEETINLNQYLKLCHFEELDRYIQAVRGSGRAEIF